jgi:hypothetical protein
MPNHVYNSLQASGTHADLLALKEKLETRPRLVSEDDWTSQGTSQFSYHAFVAPEESVTDGEYHETHGSGPDGPTGQTAGNWYNWNLNNWNTKWDAYDVDLSWHYDSNKELTSLTVSWQSAWDAPYPVFKAMVEQHPTLDWDFKWEEEQGWGGQSVGQDGDYSVTREWDIPNSHADWGNIGKADECRCSWADDPTDYFTDCPDYEPDKPIKFTVTITTQYVVETNTEERAKEAIEAFESGYAMPEYTQVLDVEYNKTIEVKEMDSGEPNGDTGEVQ